MGANLPITNISYKKEKPSDWVRPFDWITITDNADEFQALIADTGDATYTISYVITGTGNTTINWGDGTTTVISGASTSNATHVYTIGGGTPCSRGYTTFKIRITKDAGITIGSIRFVGLAANFQSIATSIGVLEVVYGDNIQTSTSPTSYFASYSITGASISFDMLEYVKLPATVSWTSMQYTFNNAFNLYKVIMPTSASSLQNLASAFLNCYNLRDITFPSNATAITTMASAFGNCTNLYTCLLPTNLDSCTSLNGAFSSCRSLESITVPSINACVDLSNMFFTCVNLLWAKFTFFPAPVSPSTSVNVANLFSTCFSLQNVYFPTSCSSNAIYSGTAMFNTCTSLKSVSFPLNYNASTVAAYFQQCTILYSVVFQSAMSSCISFQNTFNTCRQLQNITLPSSLSSSGVDFSGAFANCNSLASITIPTTYIITTLASTFNFCNALHTAVINSAQNSCTSLVSTFAGCTNLTTLTMPTSLNTCTSMSLTFQNCYSLTSVTMPSTMNAVTTMAGTFSQCYSLTSVTMPTSMSACNTFSSAFASCNNLETITLPATISASTTTFASAFSTCNRLKTITLPTTRSTSLTTINGAFTACGQLTTINNVNVLGSSTTTPLVDGTAMAGNALKIPTLSFSCPFSKLEMYGSSTFPSALNSLRLTNTSTGQWTGASPQIYIRYTSLSTAALNTLFADIAAQGNVTSKTIDITGATGAAGLSAADRLVLTSKGWTITG